MTTKKKRTVDIKEAYVYLCVYMCVVHMLMHVCFCAGAGKDICVYLYRCVSMVYVGISLCVCMCMYLCAHVYVW